jgi:hypothetical protein
MFTSGEKCGRKRQYHQFKENFEDCIIEKTKFLIKKTWKHCKKKLKYTVKPVLRGHLWDKEKWPYTTGDLL